MNSSKIRPPEQQERQFETLWADKFNELCYLVFFQNKEGAEILAMLESKYFRKPVAMPGKDPSWAFFNEGFNECIRSFTSGIQLHANKDELKRVRKLQASKPITKP